MSRCAQSPLQSACHVHFAPLPAPASFDATTRTAAAVAPHAAPKADMSPCAADATKCVPLSGRRSDGAVPGVSATARTRVGANAAGLIAGPLSRRWAQAEAGDANAPPSPRLILVRVIWRLASNGLADVKTAALAAGGAVGAMPPPIQPRRDPRAPRDGLIKAPPRLDTGANAAFQPTCEARRCLDGSPGSTSWS